MKVSIIIASYKNVDNLRKCLEGCLALDYEDYEVIVSGNLEPVLRDPKIRWLTVNVDSQGAKRNSAIQRARGELCAFVDDDACPRVDWLSKALSHFEDSTIGAVCGPGIAPVSESLMEKASSAVLASPLATGSARCRYVACSKRFLNDIGSACNLFVRRDLLLKIGGFPVGIRAAEEAFLSAKISNAGKRILYADDVVVFHKRRPLFVPLARQIGTYALHRGFLLKEHKELRNTFMLFPFAVLALLIFAYGLLFVSPNLVLVLALFYFTMNFFTALGQSGNVIVSALAMLGVPLIHLVYTLQFFKGLLTKELGESPSY